MAKSKNIARLLNMCDRVEVLSNIVHDASHTMDLQCFDALMEPYYPCLERFFVDVKGESNVVSVSASFQEDAATFTATFNDKTTRPYVYHDVDQDMLIKK